MIAVFFRAMPFHGVRFGKEFLLGGWTEDSRRSRGTSVFGLFCPPRRKAVKDEGMPTYKNPPLGSTSATRMRASEIVLMVLLRASLREAHEITSCSRKQHEIRFVHGNLFLILTIEPEP